MGLTETTTIIISCQFFDTVVDGLRFITPFFRTSIDVVFVSVYEPCGLYPGFNQRLNRAELNICEHPNHHLYFRLESSPK